jgi:uncharacterized protein YkwD
MLSLALLLAACGGGSDALSTAENASPENLSTAAPMASTASGDTPEQVAAPAADAAPEPVSASGSTLTLASTTTASPTTSLPASQTCGLPNFQQEVMHYVNQARAGSRTCGTTLYNATTPLKWNDKLFAAAAGHSTDMATYNYFSHTSRDGRTPGQRITNAGYTWSAYGENIAAGRTTVQSVINAWLQSPGHCANIMKPTFTEVAVSCAKNDASTYRYYWTMNLARPR